MVHRNFLLPPACLARSHFHASVVVFFGDWGKLFFPTVMYNTSSQQISLKAEGYDSEPWKFSSSLQLSKMFFMEEMYSRSY